MSLFLPSHAPLAVTVLILPDCSMMSVACTLDPMRAANKISHKPVFQWTIQTLDGNPVELTCGLPIAAQSTFGEAPDTDSGENKVLIIIAGFDSDQHAQRNAIARLSKLATRYDFIGGDRKSVV